VKLRARKSAIRGYFVLLPALIHFWISLTGCSPAGVQGGVISQKFNGIKSVFPISPTSVKIEWNLNSRFTKYRIYRKGNPEAIKEETFGGTLVENLSPMTTYDFSVTGFTESGTEEGLGDFISVRTLGRFVGISEPNLAVKSTSRIDLVWSSESDLIKFDIFVRAQNEVFNFNAPFVSVQGAATSLIESLTPGTSYCFFIIAKYLDGTSEPTQSSSLTAPCANTQSGVTVIPKVSLNPVVFGTYPWFLISGAEATMKTEVFEKSNPPLIDIRLGQITGNGPLRSGVASDYGYKSFYARITQYPTGVDPIRTAIISLDIFSNIFPGINQPTALVRNLSFSSSSTTKAPLFPNLVSEGLGSQSLGYTLAKGDFNCDGLPDLAVSAKDATPFLNTLHDQELGAVIIYYSQKKFNLDTSQYEFNFKTDILPSVSAVAPNPQLIYYPSSSSFHLGMKLASGNFNNDCVRERYDPPDNSWPILSSRRDNCDLIYSSTAALTNPAVAAPTGSYPSALFQKINRCDDLVISIDSKYQSPYGSSGGLFILYGDPGSGLVTSSGSNNYGVNESTCDLFSGSCRPGFFTHWDSANVNNFGRALAVGDFNNDGYDDVATSSYKKIGTAPTVNTFGLVSILRGSSGGLQPLLAPPLGSIYNIPEVVGDTTGGFYSTVQQSEALGFGFSVGVAYNSRSCTSHGSAPTSISARLAPVGPRYDFTKCDDLIIGDPYRAQSRGSIVSCKGTLGNANNTALTEERRKIITSWTCAAHYPENLGINSQYGFSILGVPNQNGYPVAAENLANVNPDTPGALFVGAPYADVPNTASVLADPNRRGAAAGGVFGYYITPSAVTATPPGIQGILGGTSGETSHSVTAINQIPCNADNNNVNNSRCENQFVYLPSPEPEMHFGWTLSSLDDVKIGTVDSETTNFDRTRNLPLLAVSAPDKSVPGPLGTTLFKAGTLYIYRPDLSVVTSNASKSACMAGSTVSLKKGSTASETCYSGGINPFGPTVIYPENSVAQQKFGLGGAVADNFNGYQETDLIAGAPSNTQSFMPGTSFPKVENHGNVYQFNSGEGGFDPSITSPSVHAAISPNLSIELNYRYDMATVVGDVDNDGYDDSITKTLIGAPSRVDVVLYYGSADGLITKPAASLTPGRHQPTIIKSNTDPLLGIKIYRAGDVNGDGFDDVLFVGSEASFLYYGSSVGLITNAEPAYTPVGKNPLKFATDKGGFSIQFNVNRKDLRSSYLTTWGNDTTTDPLNYSFDTNSVGAGDFNGDGYGDLALGIDDSRSGYLSSISELPANYETTYFSSDNRGKVVIIYGSSTGLQVPPNGVLQINQSGLATVNPCTGGNVTSSTYKCAVQIISSSADSKGKRFGYSVVGLPPMNSASKEWSLLISDPHYAATGSNKNGAVYLYRGSLTGLDLTKENITTMNPQEGVETDNQRFGHNLNVVGDINGDGFVDVSITAPGPYPQSCTYYGSVYMLYGKLNAGITTFAGLPILPGSLLSMNARFASNDPADIRIQKIRPPALDLRASELFGYGVSTIGDFNNDGYADVAFNVAKGTYQDTAEVLNAGYVLIYFGSRKGLMSDANFGIFSPNPRCLGGDSTNGVCEIYQVVLPGVQDYENTYINRCSAGDINGDGRPDLMIGGTGRNHPSGKAFSTGVIYVLY
jgi:hypothetical protein